MSSQSDTETAPSWKSYLSPLLIAIQFLSILPVGKLPLLSDKEAEKQIGHSMSFYPIVGLILGAILWSVALVYQSLFPNFLAAALVLSTWVLLTGALHLDGLADCADAWLGGLGSREKTLRIMKDPTSGPIAICTLVLLLLLKLLAIATLLEHHQYSAILWALVLARICAPLLIVTTPYARSKGFGSALTKHNQANVVWLSVLAIAITLTLVEGLQALTVILATGGCFILLRHLMMKKLDGYTGDTAGAQIEIIEALVLLCFVAITHQ